MRVKALGPVSQYRDREEAVLAVETLRAPSAGAGRSSFRSPPVACALGSETADKPGVSLDENDDQIRNHPRSHRAGAENFAPHVICANFGRNPLVWDAVFW